MRKYPNQVIIALIALFIASNAVAQRERRRPAEQQPQPQPQKLPVGIWQAYQRINHADYRRPVPGQQTLSIGKSEILLELRTDRGWKLRAKLKRIGTSDDGTNLVVLRADGDPLGFRDIPIQAGTKVQAQIGQEDSGWGPRGPQHAECRLTIFGSSPNNPKRSKRLLVKLIAPADLAGKTARWYGKTDTILYSDWRSSTPARVGLEESRKRIAKDIEMLAARGRWKGLSQSTITLDPERHFDYSSTSNYGGKRLVLIYSHAPHARLAYTASKKPSGYMRHLDMGSNYPLLLNEGGHDLTIRFLATPQPGTLERPRGRMPITIIVFGNGFGDYGPGVNYEQFGLVSPTQSDVLIRRTVKLAAAGYFEAVRRGTIKNENQLGQAIATYGRNAALASFIEEAVPSATDSEQGYLNRFGQALLSNDVSFFSLSRDGCREQIVQQLKRDRPDLNPAPEWVDFLLDLHLQRESYRQAVTRNQR